MYTIRVSRPGALLALLALGGSAVVFAGTPDRSIDSVPTVSVSYAGLDLSTQAGAAILYGRIRSAARDVCRSFESRELSLRAQWKNCYDNAVSQAVRKVDRPLLTALYDQRQVPIATASAGTAQRGQ